MGNVNLIIDGEAKRITIEFLRSDNIKVSGKDVIFGNRITRFRDEGDGWSFDKTYEGEFNNKLFFSQVVQLNSNPIGTTTQEEITILLLEAM